MHINRNDYEYLLTINEPQQPQCFTDSYQTLKIYILMGRKKCYKLIRAESYDLKIEVHSHFLKTTSPLEQKMFSIALLEVSCLLSGGLCACVCVCVHT